MPTTDCPDCDDGFDSPRGLKVHYRKAHGSTDYPWESEPEFVCPEEDCDFGCERQHGLYVHYGRSHDGPAPWHDENDGPGCPDCGFVADSEPSLKTHYTKVHDGEYSWDASSPEVSVECEFCGGAYEVHHSVEESTRFCSVECRNRWQSESDEWSGAGVGGGYSTATLVGALRELGDELGYAPTLRDVKERSEYTADPFYRAFGDYPSALEAAGYGPDDRGGDCPECGRHFESARGLRVHLTRTHDVRDGKTTPCYDGDWLNAREERIQTDGEECQDCGLTREAHREQTGTDLQVHHKTPYRSFDSPEKANQQSNLVSLCAACHARRENRVR